MVNDSKRNEVLSLRAYQRDAMLISEVIIRELIMIVYDVLDKDCEEACSHLLCLGNTRRRQMDESYHYMKESSSLNVAENKLF